MTNSEPRIETTQANPQYGKYRGFVVDNNDPDGTGRIRARVPTLGDLDTGWAMPSAPYSGDGVGLFMVPPVGAGVWIEFEAGDNRFPVWTGCWWNAGQVPSSSSGAVATPTLKIIRTEKGMLVALDDAAQTLTIRDTNGRDSITLRFQSGLIKILAASKVIIDAPQIELVNGSSHPALLGDELLQYLGQVVTTVNTHVHLGTGPGIPTSPPVTPLLPPTSSLLSTKVKTG